ncbi:MAG TPA: hypothetical protein VN240_08600, partial [Propylenella sp.]|nr:hypothetical protein [Propylenella sp.]
MLYNKQFWVPAFAGTNGAVGCRDDSRQLAMDVLNLPRPAWMTEDLVLLEDQARRFIGAEFAPHVDR